jgi:hypothetical protein
MQVIKSSGDFEKFDHKKIYRAVRNAGGSKKLAGAAVNEVRKMYREDIPTKEIFEFLLEFLKNEPGVSQRYGIKKAIMSLGPTGFPFEQFFARVLEYYGYQTTTDNKLKGKRIIHEVDIVAIRKKKWMIECKYHNESGTITDLHSALYTYARFLDLGKYGFDAPWLVTNTKCSDDAVEYARGVNLKITSWNYPQDESLQNLIMEKKLYPITILSSVSDEILNRLYSAKIVIARDLLRGSPDDLSRRTRLDKETILKLTDEIKEICGEIDI